jgi:nucleotide-binding universal stress UspA family protein
LLLVHAIPTPASLHTWRAESAAADQLARGTADAALTGLAERLHTTRPTETAIVTGPPAEAITELLEVRDAGLLVLGTASALSSHRPGSTAYRTLCLSDVPVLAVPPPAVPVADRGSIPADHYEVW